MLTQKNKKPIAKSKWALFSALPIALILIYVVFRLAQTAPAGSLNINVPIYPNAKYYSTTQKNKSNGAAYTITQYAAVATPNEVIDFYKNVGKQNGLYTISKYSEHVINVDIKSGAVIIVICPIPGTDQTSFMIETRNQ
jgi:hypothetical protein